MDQSGIQTHVLIGPVFIKIVQKGLTDNTSHTFLPRANAVVYANGIFCIANEWASSGLSSRVKVRHGQQHHMVKTEALDATLASQSLLTGFVLEISPQNDGSRTR